MNRSNKQKIILISLLVAAALLLAVFAIAITQSARIQAALEEARDRLEAEKTPTTTAPHAPIKTDGYLSLKNGDVGTMMVHYFGDDTFYGRGTGAPLDVSNEGSALSLLHGMLAATYANGTLSGRIPPYSGTVKNTNDAIYDFGGCAGAGWDLRLSILSPSDATLAKNSENSSLTGKAGEDIEALVRAMRATAPRCDILLVIPHNASQGLADAMYAIAEHYDLLTVDLRELATLPGLVHTEGEDTGYPTSIGHRAIAERIAAAIAEAVKSGHRTEEIPSTKLY